MDAADVTGLFTKAAHGNMPTLPNIPTAVSIVSVGGADPTVSLGAGVQTTSGIISVPVLLDDPDPVGSTGMTEAHLAITYDSSVLIVAPADITLGSIPSLGTGWQITAEVDAAAGQIGINLFNLARTPITSSQAGSLVNIAFQIAPGGTVPWTAVQLVSQVTSNGQRFVTDVDDDQGPLTLSPASQTSYQKWPGERYVEDMPVSDIIAHSAASAAGEYSPCSGSSGYTDPGHDFPSLTEEILGPEINTPLAFIHDGPVPEPAFQFSIAPALNSLLYANSPGQLDGDSLFQALARGTDTFTESFVGSYSQTTENLLKGFVDEVFAHLADDDC